MTAAADNYDHKPLGVTSPARKGFAVIPSNTVDMPVVPRCLWVGIQGDIAVIMAGDTDSIVLKDAVGLLPIMVKRVLVTGTEATDIVGLY